MRSKSVVSEVTAFVLLLLAIPAFAQDREMKQVNELCAKCSAGESKACSQLDATALNSKNARVRLAAVNCVTNTAVLVRFAQSDPDPANRVEACKKIIDPQTLLSIVLNDKSSWVAEKVTDNITDEHTLKNIAKQTALSSVREKAIKKINDNTIIADLYASFQAKDLWHERSLLIRQASDQSFFEKIARNTGADAIDRYEAIKKLTSQNVLSEIALSDNDASLRKIALLNLSDQKLLAQIVKTDADYGVREEAVTKIADQKIIADVAQTDDDFHVRKEAVGRLQDTVILNKIALTDKDPDVRREAIGKITNESTLLRIALNEESSLNSCAAIKNIKNPSLLALIARKKDDSSIVTDAMAKITDPEILKGFVNDRPDLLFIRSNKKFTDKKCPWNVENSFTWEADGKLTIHEGANISVDNDGIQAYIWCSGSQHTWIGTHENIRGVIKSLEGENLDPLQFQVHSYYGYKYLKGIGTVTLTNGSTIFYPLATDKQRGARLWTGKLTGNGFEVSVSLTTDHNVSKIGNLNFIISCPGVATPTVVFGPGVVELKENRFDIQGDPGFSVTGLYEPASKRFSGTLKSTVKVVCGENSYELNMPWSVSMKEIDE